MGSSYALLSLAVAGFFLYEALFAGDRHCTSGEQGTRSKAIAHKTLMTLIFWGMGLNAMHDWTHNDSTFLLVVGIVLLLGCLLYLLFERVRVGQ